MEKINEHCEIERGGLGIVRMFIRNAGPLNILNSKVNRSLCDAFALLAKDKDLRVVILAGTGTNSFIGGADIKEMVTLDQTSAETFIRGLRDVCEAVRSFPVPVIARVQGWCLGGGLEVAAACDLRIASDDSTICDARSEGRNSFRHSRGSIAASDRLGPRPLADSHCRDHRRADSFELGLVEQVVPAADLDSAIDSAAKAIADCGPEAMLNQKALLKQWEELPLSQSVDVSIKAFGNAYLTGEPQKLMQAFVDRRK